MTQLRAVADIDGEFVRRRIRAEEEHWKLALEANDSKTKHLDQAKNAALESGERLSEVLNRVGQGVSAPVSKGGRGNRDWFRKWLEDEAIDRTTARRHMKLAGFTEEERDTDRKKESAKRKAR